MRVVAWALDLGGDDEGLSWEIRKEKKAWAWTGTWVPVLKMGYGSMGQPSMVSKSKACRCRRRRLGSFSLTEQRRCADADTRL